MTPPPEEVLLIATVGGTAEPLGAALAHWRPARVLFVPSHDTRNTVVRAVELASAAGMSLGAGMYEEHLLDDAENLSTCLRQMRRLEREARRWVERGDGYVVVVDYTGGTKTMSAALALVARRWRCRFSYVGGGERTSEGVGVVVSGTERTVAADNPWNALGYQAVEEACAVFNRGAYDWAVQILDDSLKAADAPAVKRELATLKSLSEGMALWDRFQHGDAGRKLEEVRKNRNDLEALFGPDSADALVTQIERAALHLREVAAADRPSRAMMADLLANAKRREAEGRYDDGVARLYRAIEAVAQKRLADRYDIDTSDVRLEQLPALLCDRWAPRAGNGPLKLALQDAYDLLWALDDPLGRQFHELGLAQQTSPLSARNQSVLAHGFQPVGEQVFKLLLEAAMNLGGVSEDELPVFPKLALPSGDS